MAWILGILVSVAGAQDWQAQSKRTQTHLVELYSSEGCSSCPPADQFFTTLRSRKGLWRDFVPVGFHVDYWDRLGWVDKLASKRFTRRQYAYAARWKAKNVYTPGLVYQGTQWRDWRNGKFPTVSRPKQGVLTVMGTKQGQFRIHYSGGKGPHDVHVVVLGNAITSKVQSGENAGKTLTHDFVVLAWGKASTYAKEGGVEGSLTLRPKTRIPVPRYSVAAWVTKKGNLTALQATGGDLPAGWLR